MIAAAIPSRADDGNIRPFFAVGYTHPTRFEPYDHGYGVDLGFEIEQSRRASILFRMTLNRLLGQSSYVPLYGFPYTFERTAAGWSLGARVHMNDGRRARGYAEACLGVRAVKDQSLVLASSGYSPEPQGLTTTVRLGLTAGRRGGAGVFLDGGLEFLLSDPKHYGIAPIRLGVLFP